MPTFAAADRRHGRPLGPLTILHGIMVLFLKGKRMAAGKYEYFEKDGAFFRKRVSLDLHCIEEVRHGDAYQEQLGMPGRVIYYDLLGP